MWGVVALCLDADTFACRIRSVIWKVNLFVSQGHTSFWQEKDLFLFLVLKSHWKSSAAQLWVDVPAHGYWCWGLVVFAEVKVPVRSGRKCGLRMYAALCVAAREGASLW